jgi:hypothetical protein
VETDDALTQIDPTLTPQTARQRGYHWECDMFEDMLQEENTNECIRELLKDGYKLGKAKDEAVRDVIGVYKPIESTKT